MGNFLGGGTSTEYVQSPEQRQLYQMMMPLASKLFGFGVQPSYSPYTVPQAPAQPPTTGGTGGLIGSRYTQEQYDDLLGKVQNSLNRAISGEGNERYTGKPASYWQSRLNELQQMNAPSAMQTPTPVGGIQSMGGMPGTGVMGVLGGGIGGERQITGLNAPAAPQLPSMGGVLSGVSPYQIPTQGPAGAYSVPGYGGLSAYNVPGYSLPNASSLMPQGNWFSGLDPNIQKGLWDPYNEAAKQMMETMGGGGQLGNLRGGYSGGAQVALSDYYQNVTPQVAMSGWNMMQPGLQTAYGAELGRSRDIWGGQLGAEQAKWSEEARRAADVWGGQNVASQLGWAEDTARQNWLRDQMLARNQQGYQDRRAEAMTDYQNMINRYNQDYGTQMQAWQLPYNMMGAMLPGTYSTPVVQQQPGFLDVAATLGPLALLGLGK